MKVSIRKLNRTLTTSVGERYFDSCREVAFDDVSEALAQGAVNSHGGYSWIGCSSGAELHENLLAGWPDMESKMLAMLPSVELPAHVVQQERQSRRRRTRGEFGNEVDIHAVYQGQLDRAWDRTERRVVETVGNKLVHIVINLSASCGVHFDDALWRGAAALRVYEALTRMGRSVAISGFYLASRAYMDGSNGMGSCRIKDYGQQMDVQSLASVVNLGFMREYLMGSASKTHGLGKGAEVTMGRGKPCDGYGLGTAASDEDAAQGGLVLSIGACFSAEQAQKVINNCMAQVLGNADKVEALTTAEQRTWRR